MTVQLLMDDAPLELQFECVMIAQDERHSITLEGSTFIFSRPTLKHLQRYEHQARVQGVLNRDQQRNLMLQGHILDWQGVEDGRGNPIAFAAKIIPYLPLTIKLRLDAAMCKAVPTGAASVVVYASVKRLLSTEIADLVARYTTRGVVNTFTLMKAQVEAGLLSLADVQGGASKADELLPQLPLDAVSSLLEAITSHTSQMEDELKNSVAG